MRIIYVILAYLILPIAILYWLFRGIFNRSYWDRLGQRFGFGYPQLDNGSIWVHAVSVGEVQAAAPLVKSLLQRFPDRRLLLTTVTPTGAAHARRLFGEQIEHCYLPFETPLAVSRFFNAVRPAFALIMETEIWPNLYRGCGVRGIPLILVSARISPRSVKNYRKLLPLFRETLSHGILIAAQSPADAERFLSLGASPERTWVTGNIKFDIEIPETLPQQGEELRQRFWPGRPVWVAASTHDHEEAQVLDAHDKILERFPDALLVLVPRHPPRFPAVAGLLEKRRVNFVSRTSKRTPVAATTVYLVDTLGELKLFYAASDVAFMGGTLQAIGGHNLLEPAGLGVPVITGPHLFNTQQIADMFTSIGASVTVQNAAELSAAVCSLFENPQAARAQGALGRNIVAQNRGSLNRLLILLDPLVSGNSH
ncbi:MAG: 3-deoxy-D-manno-octulosonic acid transferase [Woeseia sp.]|nr:lipid IV(A) 3-deoxy-D-manno-octulosonic acid transferase [Woeseia sp.]MBT8095598.1 lipid IV(A) 3-deoxy-D-manno-octulosonic acid transferase [Woeseia sp.]NNE61232.1 3-deoxy-D-manno-octulosonic acid transferase [Woeseia sp.]NNL53595.1 3-deoxy-D-manno-octulosonic acid transferase [Woeseia sp.]